MGSLQEQATLKQFQELLRRALDRFCVTLNSSSTPSCDSSAWERDCHESLKARPAAVHACMLGGGCDLGRW